MNLSQRQISKLRSLAYAIDELILRNMAAGRALEAGREHRTRLINRRQRHLQDIENRHLRLHARGDKEAATELTKIDQSIEHLTQQIADIESAGISIQDRRTDLVAYLAPLNETLERILKYARMTLDDLGVAYGEQISPSVKADISLVDGVLR